MTHIFGGSCKTLIKMKEHHLILFLFIVDCFMIGEVRGRINPLVDFSTREELVHVAGYGEEKLSTVIITGQILCLSCVDAEAQLPPKPVSGASVVVRCGHGKKRKSWASSTTDAYGDFLIDLPSHLHAIPNLEKVCHVNVIQPPGNNVKSCINGSKRRKIKLMYIDDGIRTYTTENIHLISKPNNAHEACKISLA